MQLKRLVVLFSVLFCVYFAHAQKPDVIIQYINTYKDAAISEMKRTGVPAAIKLAQGIHETMAGTSDLVLKSNNHFGIKCKDTWQGNKVYHDDDAKGECFRSYSSAMDSYKDHSNFLRGSTRYAFLFTLDPTDYKAWAYGLKKAGYATNIRYSQILINLIETYNLEEYTLIALGKAKPTDEGLANATANDNPSNIPVTTVQFVKNVQPLTAVAAPEPQYPDGEFTINNTKVTYVKKGTSLLALAEYYRMSLSRLLDFNDMQQDEGDILEEDQLIYLQRKRKTSDDEFHVVQMGEDLYDIAQKEGIRYESLLALNLLQDGMEPAVGEKISLQKKLSERPALLTEKSTVVINAANNNASLQQPQQPTAKHIVQTKETLYSIAKKYNVNVEQIKSWNNLQDMNLKIGQELIIHRN